MPPIQELPPGHFYKAVKESALKIIFLIEFGWGSLEAYAPLPNDDNNFHTFNIIIILSLLFRL